MVKVIILSGFLVLIIINSTFQHLIIKNKMKPSKISRIFYKDDDSFIKSWKKTKERGKLLWLIKDTILYSLFLAGYFWILTSPSFEYVLTWVTLIVIFVIFRWATAEFRWNKCEDKYNKIKEK